MDGSGNVMTVRDLQKLVAMIPEGLAHDTVVSFRADDGTYSAGIEYELTTFHAEGRRPLKVLVLRPRVKP